MKLKRPSHATLVAYLALFVALGGTVYAASKINGRAIKPKSIPGNRLKPNSVTGTQVKESGLNAGALMPLNGGTRGPCDAPGGLCASTKLRLRRPSRVVAIASGVLTRDSSQDATCALGLDGREGALNGIQQDYGPMPATPSSLALAGISRAKVQRGRHRVQLFCRNMAALERPTIVSFAIAGG